MRIIVCAVFFSGAWKRCGWEQGIKKKKKYMLAFYYNIMCVCFFLYEWCISAIHNQIQGAQ